MTCFFCGGPFHPATGHQYTERVLACTRCWRSFQSWWKGWTNRPGKRGMPSFYDAAAMNNPKLEAEASHG